MKENVDFEFVSSAISSELFMNEPWDASLFTRRSWQGWHLWVMSVSCSTC